MDNEKLFSLLNSILWQDFKGFLREEYEKDKGTLDLPPATRDICKFFIAIVFSPFLFLLSPKLLYDMLICPFRIREISKYAYDIEVTTSDFKLIRDEKGKCGLCMWNMNELQKVKLLLMPRYDKITHYDSGNAFILQKNGLFGLYSAKIQKIILDCKYTSISNSHDDIFIVRKDGIESKYNSMGDRILL